MPTLMSSRPDPLPNPTLSASAGDALCARINALADEAWPIRSSDHARAESLAREALRQAEAADYPVGIALALRTLAFQQFYFHSDYEGAELRLQRALELLDKAGEARGRADLLNSLGVVHRRGGRHSEAMRLHLASMEVARLVNDHPAEARAIGAVGNVHHLLGDFGRALEHYQASLRLQEDLGDVHEAACTLINIGIIHAMIGEPERAITYTSQALQTHERGDQQAAAVCLVNLGNAYIDLGNDPRALDFLERAASRFAELDNHGDQASCLSDIGRIHERRGKDEEALAFYQRSRGLVESSGARIHLPEILM
ncbi:MAG TPA: tetratricopeptide repeat protein, partial [Longimicrobium sp.]|nr:tetratricopeptide repeat protein [Longimicrobium sp.]